MFWNFWSNKSDGRGLCNFSLCRFICRFFILEFRILYSSPLDFIFGSSLSSSSLVVGPFCCMQYLGVLSMRDVASKSFILYVLFVYWLYCMALQDEICLQLARFHLYYLYNFILAIFAECSFSIYLTAPFEDHAAEYYCYLDDHYFCWQWGKNNIIDIICCWCLFDHRCTVSLNCFCSFFLVTCCTATLHFRYSEVLFWFFFYRKTFVIFVPFPGYSCYISLSLVILLSWFLLVAYSTISFRSVFWFQHISVLCWLE